MLGAVPPERVVERIVAEVERRGVMSDCAHLASVLVRLDCGAGGTQYRRYCLKCWRDLEGAIAHAKAKAELGDYEPPLADLDLLQDAREQFDREQWRAARGSSS